MLLKIGEGDPLVAEGNFLKTCNLEPLPTLDDADKLRGFHKGLMSAGIKPRRATPE